MNSVRDQLDIFVTMLEEYVNKLRSQNKLPDNKITIDFGRRYARLVNSAPSRSVYCFVDLTNGDILKSGGWQAPAPRGKRGNIFDADGGLHCCAMYSLKYLV